jgi:FMN phosphatase YigB (HAD superfamily)
MTLTLLIDLDDTLLQNVAKGFLPAYLNSLSSYLCNERPELVFNSVMNATGEMISKRMPAQTMEQVFDQFFFPAIGTTKNDLIRSIQSFYMDVFPSLKSVTHPAPEAVHIVDFAYQQGWQVVIATNPMFPFTATRQRLEWAGVPIDCYPYELVTSYETLHFCKPSPEYYAETLAQIGWPDQPVAMLGNSLADDVIPVSVFNIPTFWIDGSSDQIPEGLHPLTQAGQISGVIPWLEDVVQSKISIDPKFESREAILAVLKSTPAALDTLLMSLSDEELTTRPEPGEWSITEILCHLRDIDQDVNWPRLEKICSEENPFLPGMVTDQWAEERQYLQQNGRDALLDFLRTRTQMVTMLESMTEEQWKRPARHAVFGPTHIKDLTGFIVSHDQVHIRQALSTRKALKA